MSRPAAKYIRQRTTDCETCGATRGRPCMRLDDNDTSLDRWAEYGGNVSPHAARLRAEAALREEQRAARGGKAYRGYEITERAVGGYTVSLDGHLVNWTRGDMTAARALVDEEVVHRNRRAARASEEARRG